jgi:hypothetical protein
MGEHCHEQSRSQHTPRETASMPTTEDSSVWSNLRPPSGGRPLPAHVRKEYEAGFATDFSKIRVHTDAVANASAHGAGGRAFTVGDDIVFGPGAWAPDKTRGRSLLAHELAHVVQQRRGGPPPWPTTRPALERDATQAAHAFAAGRPVSVTLGSSRSPALAAREPTLLRTNRDPATMSPEEIDDEMQAIRAWLIEHRSVDVEGKDKLLALLPRLEEISARHSAAAKGLSSAMIEEQKPEGAVAVAAPAPQLRVPPLPTGGVGENPLATAMQMISSFKASEVAGDVYTGTVNGRTVTLTEAQFRELQRRARAAVADALRSIRNDADTASGRYAEQQKTDARFWIIAPIIKGLGGVKDPKPYLDGYVAEARRQAARAEQSAAAGDFNAAAAAAANAELSAVKAKKIVEAYVDQIIGSGEMTVTVLQVIKFTAEVVFLLAATVATAGAGGAAATSAFGLEVTTGTAVTVIGAGSAIAEEVSVGILQAADGDNVDWGRIATHAALNVLMARFGGSVGSRVGKSLVNRFGPKAASLVAPILMHEANTVFFTVVDTTVLALRGKPMTMKQLEDELVAQMLNPKGLAFAIIQSRVAAKLEGGHAPTPPPGGRETGGQPPPAPGAGHDAPLAAKGSAPPAPVPEPEPLTPPSHETPAPAKGSTPPAAVPQAVPAPSAGHDQPATVRGSAPLGASGHPESVPAQHDTPPAGATHAEAVGEAAAPGSPSKGSTKSKPTGPSAAELAKQLEAKAVQLRREAVKDPTAVDRLHDLYANQPESVLKIQAKKDPVAQQALDKLHAQNPEAQRIRTDEKLYRPPHKATARVLRDADHKVVQPPKELHSGGMSTQERASVGPDPLNLESHTEAKAVRTIPLKSGETLYIEGQYDPCSSCQQKMQDYANKSGGRVVYWWPGGADTVFEPQGPKATGP